MTSVGVVIPVYRVERWIRACVASLAAQSVAPDQIVLVDDRGGDASVSIALEEARRLGLDVEVVTMEENAGPSAARNRGLARLTTDAVWFHDSDDTADPAFIERMVPAMTAEDAPMAICRTARVDVEGQRLSVDEESFGATAAPGVDLARALLRSELRGYSTNKLFTTELARSVPFPEGLIYEDLGPVFEMLLRSERVALVDQPLYNYLVNDASLSQSFGPHIHHLGDQEEAVIAALRRAGHDPEATTWAADLLRYRYDGVILPAANMALRARTRERRAGVRAGASDPEIDRAVGGARDRIRAADLRQLWRLGARRQSVAGGVLRASPRVYEVILDRR